jgi:hypothetical protein
MKGRSVGSGFDTMIADFRDQLCARSLRRSARRWVVAFALALHVVAAVGEVRAWTSESSDGRLREGVGVDTASKAYRLR